ncbi:unnamed protein product [Gordionus sp. m RMFG-2023]|uniref:peptidyl-prolyl cis-trans isomerase FKBP4-like n=1 Tax=Gordionus sp. m RMFG-2023 TaxID=3053472 RepID=UPI0030E54EFB
MAEESAWISIYDTLKKKILIYGFNEYTPKDGSDGVYIIRKITNLPPLQFQFEINVEIPFTIGFAENDMELIINQCLQTMKIQETSLFAFKLKSKFDSDSTYKDTIIELNLTKFTVQPEIWEMTTTEKLSMSRLHKDKGSQLFKNGNVTKALYQFSQAMKYLITFGPEPWPDWAIDDIKSLKALCYLNIAACQIQNKSYKYVIDNCTKSLSLQPNNKKAYYRRSIAYLNLGEYELAYKDAKQGLSLEPNNKPLCSLIIEIKKKIIVTDRPFK